MVCADKAIYLFLKHYIIIWWYILSIWVTRLTVNTFECAYMWVQSCLEIWGRPLLHDTISKYLKLKHNHDVQRHLPAYIRIDTLLVSNKVNNSTELEALLSRLLWHQKKCDKQLTLPPIASSFRGT